jgi:hypothetical protein
VPIKRKAVKKRKEKKEDRKKGAEEKGKGYYSRRNFVAGKRRPSEA